MFVTADEFWEAGRDSRTCAVCKKPLDRPEPGWERADLERLVEVLAQCPSFVKWVESGAPMPQQREPAPAVQDRPLELQTCSHECASRQRVQIDLQLGFAVRARAGKVQPVA